MAYEIFKTDGLLLTIVGDNTVNNATSLKLVGKGKRNYGELINENFIHMLENFSNTTPPLNPLKGQLWYNNPSLFFYDGNNWVEIIQISDDDPSIKSGEELPLSGINTGDLFWDTSSESLFVWDSTQWVQLYPTVDGTLTRIQNGVANTQYVETNTSAPNPLNTVIIGAGNNNRLVVNQASTTFQNQVIVNGGLTVNSVGKYTRQQYFDMDTQPDSTLSTSLANITWDLSVAQVAQVLLNGNRHLLNPLNMRNGAMYILMVRQDGTGNRNLTFGDAYKFEDNPPDLAKDANAVNIITFVCNGASMFASIMKDLK